MENREPNPHPVKSIAGDFTTEQMVNFARSNGWPERGVTVNGVSLETYLEVQRKIEMKLAAKENRIATKKEIDFVVRHSRSARRSRSIRNISGSRTKKGRVIYVCAACAEVVRES